MSKILDKFINDIKIIRENYTPDIQAFAEFEISADALYAVADELAALRETCDKQAAQIERMRATLEQYAEIWNWDSEEISTHKTIWCGDMYTNGYDLAEQCLKELEPK